MKASSFQKGDVVVAKDTGRVMTVKSSSPDGTRIGATFSGVQDTFRHTDLRHLKVGDHVIRAPTGSCSVLYTVSYIRDQCVLTKGGTVLRPGQHRCHVQQADNGAVDAGTLPEIAGLVTTKKEGGTMEKAKGAIAMFVDDSRRGLKIGAARRASRILAVQTRKFAGESWPKFFDTELGRELEEPIVCLLVGMLAEMSTGKVPQAERIASAAHLAMTGITAEKADQYLATITGLLGAIAPALSDVSDDGDQEPAA